jgi:hypothetical protein
VCRSASQGSVALATVGSLFDSDAREVRLRDGIRCRGDEGEQDPTRYRRSVSEVDLERDGTRGTGVDRSVRMAKSNRVRHFPAVRKRPSGGGRVPGQELRDSSLPLVAKGDARSVALRVGDAASEERDPDIVVRHRSNVAVVDEHIDSVTPLVEKTDARHGPTAYRTFDD